MNIEDCKVGMKVECQSDKYRNINKGDKLTISEVDIKEYNKSYIYFEESHSNYRAENFEPINKFEIGDEVLIKYLNNTKVKIWGKRYHKKRKKYQYAVRGCGWNIFCYESELSQLKKKDELEVGDKFVSSGTKYKVLAVGYDEHKGCVDYYVKDLNGKLKGSTSAKWSIAIDKIIYD